MSDPSSRTEPRSGSPAHAGVHFPPPILFVAGLGLGWLIDRWLPLPLWPEPWRTGGVLAGWALVGLAGVLAAWAMLTFVRHRTAIYPNQPASALVTSGPYRFSRNPMYVALSLLYVGLSIRMNSLWPVAMLPEVWFALHLLVIRREERYLAGAFGRQYEDYRGRVRRWL